MPRPDQHSVAAARDLNLDVYRSAADEDVLARVIARHYAKVIAALAIARRECSRVWPKVEEPERSRLKAVVDAIEDARIA